MRLTVLLFALLLTFPAAAQTTSHALSLMDAPKYGPDFKALDYVNVDAPKGGLLRLSGLGSFDSLNPFIVKGEPPLGIGAYLGSGLVYQSLLTSPLDDAQTEYGLIAESVEVPADLSWEIFNLRPEAKWHDGKPITAEDVVWSFETLRDKGQPVYKLYYANVQKAEALSPRKVKFYFTGAKNRELPIIMGQLPILPKHWWATRKFEETSLEPPLASGPYKVGTIEPGRSITYERVADWWGKDLPINRGRYNFAQVRYDFYRDNTVVLEAFKGSQYDYRDENSAKNWATGYDFPAAKDGRVQMRKTPIGRPAGMQAFIFNTRRAKFSDPRVRQAIGLAFDFEWTNKNLFFGEYARTSSFFQNSAFANEGLPSPEELKLLEPLRGQLPPEVFTKHYEPPKSDGTGNIREQLRTALDLLKSAGWTLQNQKLMGPDGSPMIIEFLNVAPEQERIIQPFLRNLERLGITGTIRTVDTAQYINRVNLYDYDIIIGGWGQSDSLGNEQREYWSAGAADRQGGRNYAGIKNPAIDSLIETLIAAPDRKTLIVASRALDRALLWNYYVVPELYAPNDRFAWWDRLGVSPKIPRYGVDITAWWFDPAKDAALKQRQ